MMRNNKKARKKKPKCLACKEYVAGFRGLCGNCYHHAYTAVRNKKISWKKLISLGLAKDKKRPKPNKFYRALERKGIKL